MAINQNISPLPTPPSKVNEPTLFTERADAFLGAFPNLQTELNILGSQINGTQTEINTTKTQTETFKNQAATSAGSAATSATNAANSASNSASSATIAANHVASAQSIISNLGDTQYALSQIGLGFAGVVDGELVVNYANPITNVTLSNGEISITY